jgi:DNA ligase-4
MSDRPDVYITDLSKSVILEIRAGELQVSDQYPTLYTLRFPRVLRIRYDKSWEEGFTEGELKELSSNRRLKRKENQITAGEEGEDGPKKKEAEVVGVAAGTRAARVKFNNKIVEFYRETDTREVLRKSDMFEGMEFYIVNADDQVANKPYLESRIVENGGRRVQNLMPTTTHVVAATLDFKVRTLIDKFDMNILSYRWILTCVERGFLVDLEPSYMVYSNERLQRYFSENLDPLGDHYSQQVDAKRLREILDTIRDEEVEF